MNRLNVPALSILLTGLLSAAAHAAPCSSDLPVLFVVQDKSGSMAKVPDEACPTCPTKWSSAATAVPQLVSQFANRFRFGVHLYPGNNLQFNCTVGATKAPVPSNPVDIAAVYTNNIPAGGTPTAVSLAEAGAYLKTLNLPTDVPAYILLLTDGLPNCNTALDSTTCSATTPGCENNSCGLGAKDCLDNADSIAAAKALYEVSKIKVYVVGFGSAVTANNNMAVMHAIAAAGGTGTAYAVDNQAQLTTTLNAIGYNATTCCKDACALGAEQCSPSGIHQTCVMDAAVGCRGWADAPCAAGSTCTQGTCQGCTNACTKGAGRCVGNVAETCQDAASGCTEWKVADTCTTGEVCDRGSCSSCAATCTEGAKRCAGNATETCVKAASTGCTSWQLAACATGTTCSNGTCSTCAQVCTVGAKRCANNGVETCEANASGCTSWKSTQTCRGSCSNGSCDGCGTGCTVGATRCNGASVETCAADQSGCNGWSPTSTCAEGQFCGAGACQACAQTCTLGAKRCGASGVEECSATETGCNTWKSVGACETGLECVEGDCYARCGSEESTACGDGYLCEKTSDGFFCVPEHKVNAAAKAGRGCGCGAVDPSALTALALGMLALLKRRRAK